MSDIGEWFNRIPIFTRCWFGSTVALTLLGRFGLLNPLSLILLYEPLKRFQIWRLITCVLYYPLSPATGFHYLINLYFLYNYSRRLEEGAFAGKQADYLFLLIFNWTCCVLTGIMMEMPLLMDPMILSVLYVWCQLNKDTIVSFWFGTRFKAMYLPWVLLVFNMILSGGGVTELIGILIGHLYYFLKFKYPMEFGGPSLLETPTLMKAYFPDQIGGVHGIPPEFARQAPRFRASPQWFRGRGHVLGNS